MVDIATLGIKVESAQAVKAAGDLDKLAVSAKGAEQATTNVGNASAKASDGLKKTATEAAKAGESVGKSSYAVKQLGFQLNDLGTQLASGGSPLQALAQQGGQIFQVWQQSPTVFGDTARAIGGVLSPMRLLAAGAAGAGIAAIIMAENYKSSMREVERSLAGTGRASGLTVSGINAIAEATAKQQRISISAAREIAAAYASTGMQGGAVSGLTGITRDFAAQTGQSTQDATAQLAKAFRDPVAGAMELNKELGFLDARTISYIKSLSDANQKTAAQNALIEAMRGSLTGASDRVSGLARAWEAAKNAASNAIDAAGKAVSGQYSNAERMAQLLEQRNGLSPRRTAQRALLDEQIAGIQEQIRMEQRLADQKATNARESNQSLQVRDIARQYDTTLEALEKINRELKLMDDNLSKAGAKDRIGAEYERALIAQEALRNAQATFLTAEQRATKEGALQVQSIMARTAAEQLAVDLKRQELELAGKVVSEEMRRVQIANQLAAAQANANRELRDASRAANDNLSLAGLLPYQRALKQIEIDRRNLNERTSLPASNNVIDMSTRTFVGPQPSQSSATGMDSSFKSKVQALIAAVDDSGARMTSGFRSREKQEELYERYGPGRAARPGNSQHERGTAADYVFSSPEARQRAIEKASDYGLRALPSNGGAVHFDLGRGGGAQRGNNAQVSATQATQADTKARQDNITAAQRQALAINEIDAPLRASRMELEQQRAALDLQEKGFTMSARAMAAAAKEQELLNQFQRQGVPLTDDLKAKVRELAAGYGELADRSATAKLRGDLRFEGEQTGRSGTEQQIASRLRGVYGEGYRSEMNGALAGQMRFNAMLEQTGQIASDTWRTVTDGIMNGAKAGDIFKSVLRNIATQGLNMAGQFVTRGFTSLIGSLLGGTAGTPLNILPSAQGNVFANDNLVPFARGGAFTNSIVSSPTIFPFAKGGAMGLMGESGPEAIMPLKRGSNGSLGVEMHGGSAGGMVVMQGDTQITISGNADSAAIAQIRKELAERDRNFARNVAAANRHSSLRKQVA